MTRFRLIVGIIVACAAFFGAGAVLAALSDDESASGTISAADFFPSITPSPTRPPRTPSPTPAPPSVTMAIDADPERTPANQVASLGTTENCRSVVVGETFDIDLIVDGDIPDMGIGGFDMPLTYDPAGMTVVSFNYEMLIASGPNTTVLSFGDSPPDSDGLFHIAVADLTGNAEAVPGVLARITLQATAEGVHELTYDTEWGYYLLGPTGDDIRTAFRGAEIRVGASCPGAPTPVPTPEPTPVPNLRMTFDADPDHSPANAPTSLGSIETCRSVSVGDVFSIDLVLDGDLPVGGLVGYSITIDYDRTALAVTEVDDFVLLGADGESEPISFTESTPDLDGHFLIAALDFGPNTEDIGGVLAHVTLAAIAPGTFPLTTEYTELVNYDEPAIPHVFLPAEIRVGTECPAPPTPRPTATPHPTQASASPVASATGIPTPTPTATATPIPPSPVPTTAVATTPTPTSTPTPTVAAASNTPSLTATPTALPNADLNCSGAVDPGDALYLLLMMSGAPASSNCTSAAATRPGDITCDGHTDAADVLTVLSYVAHLAELPANCS